MIRPDQLARMAERETVTALVFADSHGSPDFLLRCAVGHPQADLAIHLGDHGDLLDPLARRCPVPMIGVAGNCDGWTGRLLPSEQLLVLAGRRIYCCHGHQHGVKQQLDRLLAAGAAAPNQAEAILFGHTHRLLQAEASWQGRAISLFNPGSCRSTSGGPLASALLLRFDAGGISAEILLDLP